MQHLHGSQPPQRLGALPPDSVKASLREHARWVDSGGFEGHRLNLEGETLANLDFARADLRDAILNNVVFRRLSLTRANLQRAELLGSVILDSDLRHADLSSCRGLVARSFPGCDLTDARMPGSLREFPLVDLAAQISEKIQNTFFAILLACLFCWLTLASTTDAGLIANAGTAKLPFVDVEIPTASFYVVAPAILLVAHIYLQLHLRRLWETLAELPAMFPDGQRLDERGAAWLLANAARRFVARSSNQSRSPAAIGARLPFALSDWLVPVTLGAFLLRNVVSHHVGSMTIQAMLLSASIVFTLYSRIKVGRVLKRHPQRAGSLLRSLLTVGVLAGAWFLLSVFTVQWIALAYDVLSLREFRRSYAGAEGVIESYRATMSTDDAPSPLAKTAALSLSFGGMRLAPDISGARLTEIPPGWQGSAYGDISKLIAPDLSGRDLRGMRAVGSSLPGTNLDGSYLDGSDFTRADLRMIRMGVDNEQWSGWGLLSGPDSLAIGYSSGNRQRTGSLSNVNFTKADLRLANIGGANLEGTDFLLADLRKASVNALMAGPASFIGADLREATLGGE
ncbi:MAG TPA: pentapeptide repeat-containing protein, partial [Dongiaceae bacterium]|nr:pentapeptide repeat-containing protein [Dongiaceae bacterium]